MVMRKKTTVETKTERASSTTEMLEVLKDSKKQIFGLGDFVPSQLVNYKDLEENLEQAPSHTCFLAVDGYVVYLVTKYIDTHKVELVDMHDVRAEVTEETGYIRCFRVKATVHAIAKIKVVSKKVTVDTESDFVAVEAELTLEVGNSKLSGKLLIQGDSSEVASDFMSSKFGGYDFHRIFELSDISALDWSDISQETEDKIISEFTEVTDLHLTSDELLKSYYAYRDAYSLLCEEAQDALAMAKASY